MNNPLGTFVGLTLALCTVVAVQSAEAEKPDHHYLTSFRTPKQLGLELQKNLTPAQREQLAPDPIQVHPENKPFVLSRIEVIEGKPRGTVYISMGFIDLVNNLAHAKAVDKLQKGYFEKYVLSLAQEQTDGGIKDLPDLNDDKFWSDDVMNDQQTFFNQIAGTTIAVKLAHHYLGQFQKYAPKMFPDGDQTKAQTVRINNLLTADEWSNAMKAGTRNALDSVASVDGISMLLEAIEKMPKRPEWTSCFVPDKDLVKLAKLRKELKKVEEDFFAGK